MVSWIDFAIAEGGADRGALGMGWGLSYHLAFGCLTVIDDLVHMVGYQDAVDWLGVLVIVVEEGQAWY